MTKEELEGDPWVAQWTAPDGTTHRLYDADIELLRAVADGAVTVDSRFPKWVYVHNMRCAVRDPRNRTFRRLTDLGVIVAGQPEHRDPTRPELSTAGRGFDETTYHLADQAAVTMLAAVR